MSGGEFGSLSSQDAQDPFDLLRSRNMGPMRLAGSPNSVNVIIPDTNTDNSDSQADEGNSDTILPSATPPAWSSPFGLSLSDVSSMASSPGLSTSLAAPQDLLFRAGLPAWPRRGPSSMPACSPGWSVVAPAGSGEAGSPPSWGWPPLWARGGARQGHWRPSIS